MERVRRPPLVSTWLIKPMLAALRLRGIAEQPLLANLGVNPAELLLSNGKMPRAAVLAFLQACIAATGDQGFGLLAAEHYQPGANVFDFAGITSPNLEAALTRVCRYATLMDEALTPRLEIEGSLAKVVFHIRAGEPAPPELIDYLIGVGVIAARHWVGFDFPFDVRFRHDKPQDTTAYDRVLRGVVHFGAAEDAIAFPKVALPVPLRGANPELLPALDAQAARLMAASVADHMPLPDRVRAFLRSELEHGTPTTERIAERLHMSERTLRRRLAEHGTSLKDILDDLRREMAEQMLQEAGCAIEEVALRLGFSDATAFHRAFRRWTGKTPKAFQDEVTGRSASSK